MDALSHNLYHVDLSEDIATPFSAASLQATRLVALDNSTYFLASGNTVHKVVCSNPRKRLRQKLETESDLIEVPDYLLPCGKLDAKVFACAKHSTHRSEIMSLACHNDRLASVDADGLCVLSVRVADDRMSSYVLVPPCLGNGEAGWSGVALHQGNDATCATARQFYRDVCVYEKDILVSTVHTIVEPLAIGFLGATSNLGVIEGSSLAVYDLRVAEKSSCVCRKMPAASKQLALDSSENGLFIAVAGRDRTVHIFDMRTMTFRDRWPSCLKYECAGVKLSRQYSGLVYVCGVDNEASLGAWSRNAPVKAQGPQSTMISGANARSTRRVLGFRGDARINGIALTSDDKNEQFSAISETGVLYVSAGK